ncbi:MAG: hypothetical protein ACOX8P_05435 [Tepidanaerobacteraceae bacterium]|jgi:hypothetical protein
MEKKSEEYLIGMVKAGFSAIPFIGGLFNEFCFDIRGRIAQRRINDFTNSFLAYIDSLGIKIDENILISESFNDMFISILKRVADTKCEHKLNIFRKILKSSLIEPYESDFRETFLELVNKLDYMEIEIMKLFQSTGRSGGMDIPEGVDGCISTTTSRSYKDEIMRRIKDTSPNLTTIEVEGKYEFYICDLISKAILVDTKTKGNTWGDIEKEGLTVLYMTDFGKEFLRFIKTED